MKRILLGCLSALAFVCGLQAQSLDIYVNGTLMQEGDTLTITRATVEGNAMLRAFTIFKNTGETAVTLKGTKVPSLPEGVHDGWCIWQDCKTLNEITSDYELEAGKMFEGSGEYLDITPAGYVGKDICITYTFSTVEKPDETLTFTLQWELGKPEGAAINMTVDGQEVTQSKFIKIERPTEATKMLHVEMTFENTGSEAVKMVAERAKFLAPGTSTDWCLFGACLTQDRIVGMEPLEPGLTESTDMSPQYLEYTPKGYVGESVVYYSFYAQEDPFNRTDFVVRWVTTGSANENAAEALQTAVYPNPAVETARLTWEAVEGAVVLNVRSVSGQLLYSRSVEGMTEAEINVAGFTPGMYFYTLERQGERLGSGKLLVR
ncbi:MAG: T9SS type A sorting domain-containing protein [Bacteroidales bacterium]|nr:T9SS type A sorting domain-containing protein [Bacteroidales bacterium]